MFAIQSKTIELIGSAQGVDDVVQKGVVGGQSLGAHVARSAAVVTHLGETAT